MAPEQIRGESIDRRADVFAAAVVLWEALAGRRLFEGQDAQVVFSVLEAVAPPPSSVRPDVSAALDALVLQGLAKKPTNRFQTALDMARALESVVPPARARDVGLWVASLASETLERQASLIHAIESEHLVEKQGTDSNIRTLDATQTNTSIAVHLERRIVRSRRLAYALGGAVLLLLGTLIAVVSRSGEPPNVVPTTIQAAADNVEAAVEMYAEVEQPLVAPVASFAPASSGAVVSASASASALPARLRANARPSSHAQAKPSPSLPYPYEF